MKGNPLQLNNAKYTYLSLCVLLVSYVVWRSINISFTHDESLSYTLITGNETQLYTANNHWLNTILMYLSSKIFGYSELALRLPNVLAFVLYLVFVYKIFTRFSLQPYALLIAVPLLLFNHFMLDFFGLARGYGLGIAFFTAAIYYFMLYFQKQPSLKYLLLLVFFSLCCIYANYAFLIAILGLHLAAVIGYFSLHKKHFVSLLLCYLLEGILLIPAILNILYLSKINELYAGGDNNVFEDTLKSVIHFSFDNALYDLTIPAIWLIGLSALIGFLFCKSKSLNYLKLSVIVLLFIPWILHISMNMGYPKDRAAQYWMVMTGLFVLFAANAILKSRKTGKKAFILTFFGALSLLATINFCAQFNLTHTAIWKYDSDVKKAVMRMDQTADHARTYSIGTNWTLEPSLNYYRETRDLKWMSPVWRDGVKGKYDFYLFFKEDFASLDSTHRERIVFFPKSELYLYKSR